MCVFKTVLQFINLRVKKTNKQKKDNDDDEQKHDNDTTKSPGDESNSDDVPTTGGDGTKQSWHDKFRKATFL